MQNILRQLEGGLVRFLLSVKVKVQKVSYVFLSSKEIEIRIFCDMEGELEARFIKEFRAYLAQWVENCYSFADGGDCFKLKILIFDRHDREVASVTWPRLKSDSEVAAQQRQKDRPAGHARL